MDRKEFFKRLTVDLPLYATFNTLRDETFTALAVEPRNPMSEGVLQDIVSDRMENGTMNEDQMHLISTFIEPNDTYRLYQIKTPCNIDLLYIVNMCKTVIPENDIGISNETIAAHMMAAGVTPESGEPRVDFSVICLAENHNLLTPVKYPKIIKHELVHVAMNRIAIDNEDIRQFIEDAKNGDKTTSAEYAFIEFMCNIVPYLSVPVKKENGIDKFMEDSHVIFGYDENDPMLAEAIAIINEVQQEMADTTEE